MLPAPYLPPINGHRWIFDDSAPIASFDPVVAEVDEVHADDVAGMLPALGSLLLDRHLGFDLDDGERRSALDAALAGAARDLDAHAAMPAVEAWQLVEQPIRELLVDGHLRVRFEPAAAAAEEEFAPIEVRRLDDGTTIIDVRNLFAVGEQREQLRAFAEGELPADTSRVVFDLRGCPGGDDSWTARWIQRRITAPVALGASIRRTGPARAIDEWNQLVKVRHWFGDSEGPDMSDWLEELAPGEHVRDTLQRLGDDAPSGLATEPGQLDPASDLVPFDADAVVLVDAGTGSSAESTAFMLREAFGARLVGRATRGCIDYGNVFAYPLPGSGIAWQLPTHSNRYPGSPVDLRGISVDVELDDADMDRPAEELLPLLTPA